MATMAVNQWFRGSRRPSAIGHGFGGAAGMIFCAANGGWMLSVNMARIGSIYVRPTDSRLEYGVKIRRPRSIGRTALKIIRLLKIALQMLFKMCQKNDGRIIR
jgi:hypothetical protein